MQMKRYTDWGLKGPEPRNFCLNGVEMPHPPGVDAFSILEILQILYCLDFMEESLCRHFQLLTSF